MNKSAITGVTLIVIGLVFLLPNFIEDLTLRDLWPVLVLGPGILFIAAFLADRQSYGFLMPGSILTLYGLIFLYCTIFGWYWMHDLWPFFVIGPGIGFFLMYYFGKKETGLLIPGSILTLLGVIFLLSFSAHEYFWPLLIIATGLFLILRSRKKPTDSDGPAQTL